MTRKSDIKSAIEGAGFNLDDETIAQFNGGKRTTYGFMYKGREKGDGLLGTWYVKFLSHNVPPEEAEKLRTAVGKYSKE